jgi:hypothetical protein
MRKSFAERNRNTAPLFGSFPRGKPRIRTNDPITPHQTAGTEGHTAKKKCSPRKTENRRKPPRRKHVPPRKKQEQTLRVFPAKRCETPGTDKNHREEINFPILSARPPFRPLTPSGRNPAPRRMIRTTEQKDVSLFLYPILHEFHSFVNTPRTAILINPLNNPLKKKKIFFSARPRGAHRRAPPTLQDVTKHVLSGVLRGKWHRLCRDRPPGLSARYVIFDVLPPPGDVPDQRRKKTTSPKDGGTKATPHRAGCTGERPYIVGRNKTRFKWCFTRKVA